MHFPSGTKADPGKKKRPRPGLTSTLGQVFKNAENHPKSNLVFGSKLGRRLSISQNSTAVLNHFSARVFLLLTFRPQIGRFCCKLTKKGIFTKKVPIFENLSLSRPPRTTKLVKFDSKRTIFRKVHTFPETKKIAPAADKQGLFVWTSPAHGPSPLAFAKLDQG